MRWAKRTARMGDTGSAHRILVARLDGKGLVGRLRRRWEGNIKMYLQGLGWGHGQDRSGSG